MKVAVLSDIHANLPALDAVLRESARLKVSRFIFAGDFLGYYFNGGEVLDRIRHLNAHCVRGNHDQFYIKNYMQNSGVSSEIVHHPGKRSFDLLKLSLENKKFLSGLPHPLFLELHGRKILLAHGHPSEINLYVYPNDIEEKHFLNYSVDLIILGHTHWQTYNRFKEFGVLNPGSVGQPRDGIPGAAWALLDLSDLSVEFYRTQYDNQKLLSDCKEFDPDNYALTKQFFRDHV